MRKFRNFLNKTFFDSHHVSILGRLVYSVVGGTIDFFLCVQKHVPFHPGISLWRWSHVHDLPDTLIQLSVVFKVLVYECLRYVYGS